MGRLGKGGRMKVTVLRLGPNNEARFEKATTGSELLHGDGRSNLLSPESVFSLRINARREFVIALLAIIMAVSVGYSVDQFGVSIEITIGASMVFAVVAIFAASLGVLRRRYYKPLVVAMEGETKPLTYMHRFPEWQERLQLIFDKHPEDAPLVDLAVAIEEDPVLNRGFRQSPRSDEETYAAVSNIQAVKFLKSRPMPWEIIVIIMLGMVILIMAVTFLQFGQPPEESPAGGFIGGFWRG